MHWIKAGLELQSMCEYNTYVILGPITCIRDEISLERSKVKLVVCAETIYESVGECLCLTTVHSEFEAT
jgi:hypothetical protein